MGESFHQPVRIISGGQTGADRGALEAALDLGISHGGTCPRGRRAEDGVIPDHYLLRESESGEYAVRTRANVEEGDATLVVIGENGPGEGTQFTMDFARQRGRPVHVVETRGAQVPDRAQVEELKDWLSRVGPVVLNVAGSRESEAPGAMAFTRDLLMAALRSA